MSGPTTEAGRALARDLWGAYAPGVERTTPEGEVTMRSRIVAIEAEARAPLREALDRLARFTDRYLWDAPTEQENRDEIARARRVLADTAEGEP